jgi:hypothetical protein
MMSGRQWTFKCLFLLRFSAFCEREWKSVEVLGSGEKVGRVGIEPTTN